MRSLKYTKYISTIAVHAGYPIAFKPKVVTDSLNKVKGVVENRQERISKGEG